MGLLRSNQPGGSCRAGGREELLDYLLTLLALGSIGAAVQQVVNTQLLKKALAVAPLAYRKQA